MFDLKASQAICYKAQALEVGKTRKTDVNLLVAKVDVLLNAALISGPSL